jgi:flagellar basal body-associated protein FliL
LSTEEAKRRNGFILVIVAVVLVLIVAGVGVFLLTRGGSTDDPTEAAREFTTLYERGLNTSGRDVDVADFEPLVCAAVMPSMREAFSAKENPVEGAPQFKLSVKDVKTEGDKGSFTVTSEITTPGNDKETSDEPAFTLVLENGGWRVCGIG